MSGQYGIRLSKSEQDLPIGERIGHVRWTICAMLFAATTINYMDRQVIGLLKPTHAGTASA